MASNSVLKAKVNIVSNKAIIYTVNNKNKYKKVKT